MTILIIIVGLFLIVQEEANKNVLFLNKEQRRHVETMRPFAQKDRQLKENLPSGKIFRTNDK